MSDTERHYILHIAGRVVRMFQAYTQNIDPADPDFAQFITNYLASKGVTDPKSLAYSELYKLIKHGIQEYLETKTRPTRKRNRA